MDPTNFIAATRIPTPKDRTAEDAFYEEHGHRPFGWVAHLYRHVAGALARRPDARSPEPGFAMTHPAE